MSRKTWITDPNDYLEPLIASSGAASIPAITVTDFFKETVRKHGNRPAVQYKTKANGVLSPDWTVLTWEQYFNAATSFAKSLIHLGVQARKCTNIIGFNSYQWFIANSGTILAGCIPAGIYTSNLREACLYISEHSQAEVIIVEDNKQLAKFIETGHRLPSLKAFVVWAEPVDQAIAKKCTASVYSFDDFLKLGSDVPQSAVDERSAVTRPGHCATLIYTSGTTGPPKAVMISHDNLAWTIQVFCENFLTTAHTDKIVSYLPLSHVAGQLVDMYYPMFVGGCTYFAQPDALKGTLTHTLKEVKPTMFFGVPRVWEKMMEAMVAIGRETTGIKKSLSTWAKGLGAEHSRLQQFGNGGGAPWGYGCANALILSKIKEALGLDECRSFFTAAAPISPDVINYFGQLDIQLFELFGQSECTGPHTSSKVGAWKVGACGRPMPGTETKIDPSTKELCYRGRHIFMGYMYMPEKTAETIDEEGYLHSGDVAEFDNDDDPNVPKPSGFMRITGRIKELIITAGGENIPPVLIENEMKGAMVALSNCMVVGDRRKFLGMLVSLKTEVDKDTGAPTDKLAKDALFVGQTIGSTATTLTEASKDPLWAKYIEDGRKVANSKTTSAAQIVQKWKWLPCDFSEKAGDLTPTLKLKRNVVSEKYAELIDSIYEGSGDA